MSQCPKTTKDGRVQCRGAEGHEGPCFLGGVTLDDFDRTAEARSEAASLSSLRAALIRAHCDLRALEGLSGKGSVALAENAAAGFDHEWERRWAAR